uniref:HlyD family secretion protein n=1 Tax=Candidatus Kentrum sp. LFY TaxID=2126342 RepID=A0A450WRX0_9GAMM|nr:MAG: HlyD family secretion protein [Candidatus Kentron sp. LFY]
MDGLESFAPLVVGWVQELVVSTVGGIVTDAQQLMLVILDEEKLEAEVFLENKDIGFVREAMPAEIKSKSIPFPLPNMG